MSDRLITQHQECIKKSQAMGGPAKLEAMAAQGRMNVRQRIDALVDADSFEEYGLFATSQVPRDKDRTPADGKVTGIGKIGGRAAAVVGYDFSVKGSSSSPVSNKKMHHMKELGARNGMPVVYLAESTGVRMPDIMGAAVMGSGDDSRRFLRRRESPWVTASFGHSFGSAAWHTVAADFSVMVKGATMSVSSSRLVSRATGHEVDAETLGGWKLQTATTGLVDLAVDTDAEAIAAVRNFLSYLPSHNMAPPPATTDFEYEQSQAENILNVLPESRNQVYDVHKIIEAVADARSVFEVKRDFGKSLVTALARINGQVVGIIANNPVSKGGAIDTDACDKATSFIVLCDSYNIPLVHMVDQPGFLIGLKSEQKRVVGKIINWMNALSLVTVPKITVIMRKSYGQALANMGGVGMSDVIAAWYTAEVGFMDPHSAVHVVHKLEREDNPEQFDTHLAEMAKSNSAYDLASAYGAQQVIDPRETRDFISNSLHIHRLSRTGGIGEHHLSNWPTTY